MMKTYEFTAHPFELPIERKDKIQCKVWEADFPSPSVTIVEYDFGKDSNDKELKELAEHIIQNYHMSVVAIEYAETKIKYSPDLLKRLETLLPDYLREISPFLSSRHQELVKQGAFQDVIDDLQYNPFTRIPVNSKTIISLYGNENSYTDFGIAASLDLLFGIESLKEIYPMWQWNDCIGIGTGYGAYISQLAEKLSPNTFSFLIGINSLVKPQAVDLFANRTELENGTKQFAYTKSIGEFPLYLNEVQGWTTATTHPNFFEQRHYDIRNLEYELHLDRSSKRTPLIFVEELSPQGIVKKVDFVEKLIKHNFPVELFVADENEIDNKKVFKQAGTIKVKLKGIFDYYMSKDYSRNLLHSKDKKITILPVYKGVYILNMISKFPKFFFIPSNLHLTEEAEMEYLSTFFEEDLKFLTLDSMKDLLYYIKNPLEDNGEDYCNIIK